MDPTRPVIIVGAPRSGTNMLRDLVTAIDGLATWPCDEIPGIWLHGNLDHPNDELTAADATPRVVDFIRDRFAALAARSHATPVEKTCATSLRMPFVDAVFPDARYIFISRHGLDATASAMKRWTGTTSLSYLTRKARWTPPSDLPRFVWRSLRTRLAARSDGALSTWGPKFDGMVEMARDRQLHEVCAEQWVQCVDRALDHLDTLPAERVLRLKYEDVVRDPGRALEGIAGFLDIDAPDLSSHPAFTGISSSSIGKGTSDLTPAQTTDVMTRIEATLGRLAYGDRP